jgi:hypothetical protein
MVALVGREDGDYGGTGNWWLWWDGELVTVVERGVVDCGGTGSC